MSSVICIHYSQSLCRPLCSTCIHLNNIIEHTHAKIVISALERQESWGDTNDEVVGQPLV